MQFSSATPPVKMCLDIDRERAKSALERAEAKLADASLSKEERRLAESAKRRAQVRLSIPQA